MVVKFKKRIFIAIILTIISLVLTNNFWLTRKPIEVSFNIEGKGKYEIKAYLNAINNEYFRDSKIVKKEIELTKKETITGKYNLQKGKRFKIDFTKNSLANASNIYVYISNLNFRNGKFKITDYENFIAENATIKADENSLKIIPKAPNFSVIYKPNFKLRAAIKFEFEVFVIILILSFLLFNKLLDYAADFKTIKHKSRIEILFLICFFIILFIPMLNINQDAISSTENRTLARWKPFINKDKEINFNFGKDFDNWFNDRFNFRKIIIKAYKNLNYNLALNYYQTSGGFVNKKNNFMGSFSPSSNKITEEEYKKIASNLKKLKEFCKDNKIDLYIAISPLKQDIYGKEYAPVYKNSSKYPYTIDIINKIKKDFNIDILYLHDDIKNLSKEKLTFFKTDHHWTDEAAYIAYLKLMQKIKKKYPNIKISSENDFNYKYSKYVKVSPITGYFVGRTYEAYNLDDDSFFDFKYKYFYHKNINDVEYRWEKCNEPYCRIFHYHIKENKHLNNINVTLFGDSFVLNLANSFNCSFKNFQNIYVWYPKNTENIDKRLQLHEQDIIKHKSKILILCFSHITRLGTLFEEEK